MSGTRNEVLAKARELKESGYSWQEALKEASHILREAEVLIEIEEKPRVGTPVGMLKAARFLLDGELYRRDRLLDDGRTVAIHLVKVGGTLIPKEAKILDPDSEVEEVK